MLRVQDVRAGESLKLGPQSRVRFRDGKVSVGAPNATEQELRVGESMTVNVGELDYTLSCSELGEATFEPSRRRWALLDAAALALALAALWVRHAPSSKVELAAAGVVAAQAPLTSPEAAHDQPVREAVFAVVAEAEAERWRVPGEMRCGVREMGSYVEETAGRYGIVGPPDNADPHLARPVAGHGHPWFDGIALDDTFASTKPPQTHPGSSGPTALFGRDIPLATDPKDAAGDMWGEALGDAWGDNGFGVAPEPGGVVKRFDVAPLADTAGTELRVVHTGLRVTGARQASEVGRVMAARFAEFRRCGEIVTPSALHDVELGFDVDEAGRAVASHVASGALEQCLSQSLAGAVFAPGAREKAHVVYPLRFAAANVALKGSPVARPSGGERCDCGG